MSNRDEDINFIEAYFKNQLKDAEKKQFEDRCIQDERFARQVALFITVEEGIRQKLLPLKQQDWKKDDGSKDNSRVISFKNLRLRNWLPYAAAACLIFVVALYVVFRPESPQQMASKYITGHFSLLSQTMNASKDSLQQGLAAFNNKEYDKALQFFENISLSQPENGNAKKYAGIVYLVTEDYDKAIQQFDELARMKGQYTNAGLFLKATTLLTRNNATDKEQAKQLLERVIQENLEGSREARLWLDRW